MFKSTGCPKKKYSVSRVVQGINQKVRKERTVNV